MATKFPKFSQGLAQDPTTRRIWFGIATSVRLFCIYITILVQKNCFANAKYNLIKFYNLQI